MLLLALQLLLLLHAEIASAAATAAVNTAAARTAAIEAATAVPSAVNAAAVAADVPTRNLAPCLFACSILSAIRRKFPSKSRAHWLSVHTDILATASSGDACVSDLARRSSRLNSNSERPSGASKEEGGSEGTPDAQTASIWGPC